MAAATANAYSTEVYSSEERVKRYDVWADAVPNHELACYNAFRYFGGPVAGKTVADYGCGSGKLLRMCVERGAALCLGVEYSAPMIERAKKADRDANIKEGRIQYFEGNCLTPFSIKPNGVDFATSQFMLHHCAKREEIATFYRNIYADLKPGGKMLTVLAPYCGENELDLKLSICVLGADLPLRANVKLTDPFPFDNSAYMPVKTGFDASADASAIKVPAAPIFVFEESRLWSTEYIIDVMRAEKFVNVRSVPVEVPEGMDPSVGIAISRMSPGAQFVQVGGEKPL